MGIPCSHVISVIHFHKEDPQAYVSLLSPVGIQEYICNCNHPPSSRRWNHCAGIRFQFDDVDEEFQDLENVDIDGNGGQRQDGKDEDNEEE